MEARKNESDFQRSKKCQNSLKKLVEKRNREKEMKRLLLQEINSSKSSIARIEQKTIEQGLFVSILQVRLTKVLIKWEEMTTFQYDLEIFFDSDMTVEGLETLLQENNQVIEKAKEKVKNKSINKTVSQKKFETLLKEISLLEEERKSLVFIIESKGVNVSDVREKGIMDEYR